MPPAGRQAVPDAVAGKAPCDDQDDREEPTNCPALLRSVFYIVNAGPYAPSLEFSARDQAVAYARERTMPGLS